MHIAKSCYYSGMGKPKHAPYTKPSAEVGVVLFKEDTKMSKAEILALQQEVDKLQAEKDALITLRQKPKKVVIKPSRPGDSEATAIVLFSDWHYEEEVRPASVFGRNRYNVSIAAQRANECFAKTVRLLKKEKQDVAIKECIVGLLGDFITGNIHEENVETAQLQPIEAIICVRNVLHEGIRYLLANTDVNFTFVCSAGNHSRITKKQRYATEQGNSLEWFLYHQLANDFKSEKRVKFVLEEAYHTYVNVYGRVLRFHHGHNVKFGGGIGGLTIPLNKAIAQWNSVFRADYDLLGHHHQYMIGPNYVVNGSMVGYNAYCIAIKAGFEKPKQAFMLLDKDRGMTVHIPIVFSV